MKEAISQSVSNSLIRIHKVITRGLEVSLQHTDTFINQGFPNETTKQGFMIYIQTLASVIHGHHLAEDDLAFPYFENIFPKIPYTHLCQEHERMQKLVDMLQPILSELAESSDSKLLLQKLKIVLENLDEIWHPHYKMEESHIKEERVNALISMEEQMKLNQSFSEHSKKNTGPEFLVIPFMLYNLNPVDRADFAAAFPPVVTQELVPHVWKDQWAPMQPFLLE